MIALRKPSDTPLDAVPAGTGPVVLPQVDLLPPEIGERQRFRKVQLGLGSAVVAAVGVVALLYVGAAHSVSSAETQVQAADQQQSALQAETARYQDVTQTYSRAAAAEAMLVGAMGQEVRYSRLLNDVSMTIPADVFLTNVTVAQAAPGAAGAAATTGTALGTVTMSGVALDHDHVAEWLESLAGEKGYKDAYLTSATEAMFGGKKVVNWSTTVSLTPDALSHRYTKQGS